MGSVFDPARHEPLAGGPWSPEAARAGVRRIVAAAHAEFRPGRGWTGHPLDDPEAPDECFHLLYHGTAGALLALRHLGRRGVDAPWPGGALPLLAAARDLQAAALQGYRHGSASWLLGTSGMDRLLWTCGHDAAARADRLHADVAANLRNPVGEPLWGNAGTVLAAVGMAEDTAEPRWGDLVRAAADALESGLQPDDRLGVRLWAQDLYGRPGQTMLGAGHGFAGNVFPFLRGAAWLPLPQVQRVLDEALRTLQATALRADGAAHWQPDAHPDPARLRPPLVQDCHGAPGIVCRLAGAPRTGDWDALLREAGEATWRAGPLVKGASMCHGTGGSALALLKLWRRSAEPLWLDRARVLAMHALAQVERHRQQHGQGRHSLWTGDLGVACIVQACVAADPVRGDDFPSLDVV